MLHGNEVKTEHSVTRSPRGKEFIERLGRLSEGEGLPRTAGRMMGLLMLYDGPLSIDDIARELKISRASVSTNGRLLQSLEIATRVTQPGDRRDYLHISRDPCNSLLALGVRRLNEMRRAVRDMRGAVSRPRSEIRQRLERMEEFYNLAIERAESVLADWQRHRATRSGSRAASRTNVRRSARADHRA